MWSDAEQMNGYYALGIGFEHLGPHFAGQPTSSTWRRAGSVGRVVSPA